MPDSTSSQSSPDYDIAIVGGGVSGVYTGWRLVTAKPGEVNHLPRTGNSGALKVALFEGSDRIGGRLLSARPPGFSDSTTCEIGGMRYVSSQELVRSLVENQLNLRRYEQVVYNDDAIAYLRGKRLRCSQLQDPDALPYDLEWAEAQYVKQQKDPTGLIAWAIGRLLPEVTQYKGEDLHRYLREAKIDEGPGKHHQTPLYKHGFWNLLARILSQDAYTAAHTLIGYDCLGSNANAVDLILEIFDFAKDVKYYLLNDGYEIVPWMLQQKFEEAGGKLIANTWLAGFDKTTLADGSAGVVLRFRGGRPDVTARHIILAMPRRSIELLKREGPVLDPSQAPDVPGMLNSVRAIPLYKLFLVYEYPWWNAVAGSVKPLVGRSLTDTPARQVYYWPVDPNAPQTPSTGRALLMAYNDATNVDFWEGLSGTPVPDDQQKPASPKSAELEHFRKIMPWVPIFPAQMGASTPLPPHTPPPDRLRKNWMDHRAPYATVMEMHRQIARMHGMEDAPRPVDAAYMDWSVDPFGGGVHFWNRGYKSWELLEQMTKPVKDFPCYICGEAYSTNQTWVEGALQTAEIVLQTHYGMTKPGWVTPNPKG
jgi:hypothetical protein